MVWCDGDDGTTHTSLGDDFVVVEVLVAEQSGRSEVGVQSKFRPLVLASRETCPR